jgi:hypothetical protein
MKKGPSFLNGLEVIAARINAKNVGVVTNGKRVAANTIAKDDHGKNDKKERV